MAEDWIVNKCGVTASGRVRTVFKTELGFNELFLCYKTEGREAEHVLVNVFAWLARQKHVHFGVGAVDTMTCSEWGALLEHVQTDLLAD